MILPSLYQLRIKPMEIKESLSKLRDTLFVEIEASALIKDRTARYGCIVALAAQINASVDAETRFLHTFSLNRRDY
jgi:hypothetical protein